LECFEYLQAAMLADSASYGFSVAPASFFR
jgi:hypothetical protein